MSFVLQGEVNIDGRKGIVTLKSIQREATRTSQSFDRAGSSTSKLVASFLKANSAASVFGTSLRALGRFGGAGILGAGAATALNRFGEAVKKNATDYFQAQKSLADAFEMSFKSKNVEESRAALEKTRDIIDDLRGKITQLGTLGNILGGFEKFTGLKIFGVEDTKKALGQAQQQLTSQEKIFALKQKEKNETDKISSETSQLIQNSKQYQEILKFEKDIGKRKNVSIELAKEDLKQAIALRDENSRILDILKKTSLEGENDEKIRQRRLNATQLEFNIFKAQNNLIKERTRLLGETLTGSRAGQQAVGVAQGQKERADRKRAFREEQSAVKQRQAEENASRAAQGLPMLNQADIRKRMATEAVGGELPQSAQGVGAMAMDFSQNLLGDRAATMAATKAREEAAPSDFGQRVEQFKAREAQKVMQEEGAEKKKGGYQKTKIRGQGKGSSGGGDLASAIKALADKIPSAVPQ